METVYYKKAGVMQVTEVETDKHIYTPEIEAWLRANKVTQAWIKGMVCWRKIKYCKVASHKREFKWFNLPSNKMLPKEIALLRLLADK